MYLVLSITIPFFAIIFLGTFFKALKVFNNEASRILTNFALYVTLPPFIFINIIKSSNNVIFEWDFIVRFEIITLFILFLSFIISKYIIKNDTKKSSIFALNSSYPNYGYMGIPLCILAFGQTASIPISVILLIDSIVLLSFTSLLNTESTQKNYINKFFLLFLSMLKNPILLSVFIGFFFILLNIKLNTILFKFLDILAFAATPTALFAIGLNIYGNKITKSFGEIYIISFIKLFLHPLLIFLIFSLFPSNINPLWIKVAILCSCLPVAGNVYAMSIFYDSFTLKTSNSILFTTVLSTFTVPFVLFYLLL